MHRRTILAAAAFSLAVGPRFGSTQNATVVRRIGWIGAGEPLSPAELQRRYGELQLLGWVEGRNLTIERRHGRVELLPRWVEEFVRLRVDVIVADGTAASQAAKDVTTTIPIVMWGVADPVGTGLVRSLALPGGNITGYAVLSPELDRKRLSLLRELLPGVQHVGELIDSNNPYSRATPKRLESAYRSLGMQPIYIDLALVGELEDAIEEVHRRGAQALHVPYADSFDERAMQRIMRAALRYMLPTVVDAHELLDAGGLLSLGVNDGEMARRGALLVDKVLRGAKPSELPIEQPTKFDLGINLKSADALKITIPQALILRADTVIR